MSDNVEETQHSQEQERAQGDLTDGLEPERLVLEREKIRGDLRIREAELVIRRRELELKRDELERSRVSLEQEKVRGELRIGEAELESRNRELELKRMELLRGRWANPLTVGIVAGLLGFSGNVIALHFQGRSALELEERKFRTAQEAERVKFQSNLIIEAIKTGDQEAAARNVSFLVKVGFIDEKHSDKISSYIAAQENLPVLPPNASGKSSEGRIPTALVFANRSEEPVLVYWLDYAGKEVFYRELRPGESYRQSTYVTHPWVIRQKTGEFIKKVVAGAKEEIVGVGIGSSP